jgi:hypothetical protein
MFQPCGVAVMRSWKAHNQKKKLLLFAPGWKSYPKKTIITLTRFLPSWKSPFLSFLLFHLFPWLNYGMKRKPCGLVSCPSTNNWNDYSFLIDVHAKKSILHICMSYVLVLQYFSRFTIILKETNIFLKGSWDFDVISLHL